LLHGSDSQRIVTPGQARLTVSYADLPEEDLQNNSKSQWIGDFSSRPHLIADLLPAIKQEWGLLGSRRTLANKCQALRTWWRVLDLAEAEGQNGSTAGSCRVNKVEDLHELHYVISKRLRVSNLQHGTFLRLVNIRLKEKSLPALYWPSPDYKPNTSEVPAYWEIEAIRHKLKRQWFATLNRWETADDFKPDLEAWKACPKEGWKQHVHSVYRAVVQLSGNPTPSMETVAHCLQQPAPVKWMGPLSVPQMGLYPNGDDLRAAFNLCLLYSGWNVQTLVDIDIEGRCVEDHPTNPDYHLLWGFKNRGQTEHFCIGRKKRSDSPGTIVSRLVDRTAPLRAQIRIEHQHLLEKIEKDPANKELAAQRHELEACLKSPWLFLDAYTGIRRLTATNCNSNGSGQYLRMLIQDLNQSQPSNKQVRDSITPSDFRDAYIAFAYEFSNYSILTAQTAANHRNVGTTQRYLRHKAWRAHSAGKARDLSSAVWREIKIHRKIEPAILRAEMEHGEVSDEQRQRLAQHQSRRSRVGLGCKDFTNPPASLAPEHVQGSGCRVQRCTLCPTHAIVFEDSLDHLARRQAELEDTRNKIPVPVWSESSFPEELENTEQILQRFDAEQVRDRLTHWHDQIKSGLHIPVVFEGTYE
jgi:hypothetical protein